MSFFFVVCMDKTTIMHILDSNSSDTLIQTPTGLPEALTLLSLLKDVEETFKSLVYILWQLQSSIIMLLLLVLQCFLKAFICSTTNGCQQW